METTIEGNLWYHDWYFSYSLRSRLPFIVCEGAKNMSSVELTIFDNEATSWNVVDLAPIRLSWLTPYATHGSSSSSLMMGGRSTVIALTGI